VALRNSVFGLLEQLESTCITVHQNRCAVVRNRNATCLKCAEACTSGCIAYADNELVLSPDRCIGCGTCATVCPTCALEAHRPNDAELLRELLLATKAAGGTCTVACVDVLQEAEDAYDRTKVVGVACLGRIEESALVSLVAAGAERIDLVKGDCEACPYGTGLEAARSVCTSAIALLRAWNNGTHIQIADELPASTLLLEGSDCDESRRALFSALKNEARGLVGHAAAHAAHGQPRAGGASGDGASGAPRVKVMPDGTLPHFVPPRRELLLERLSDLGKPQDVLIETRLWGQVALDADLCNACQMCATFCPTGALSKYVDEDGGFGIEYGPRDCVKCGCCADICPTNALTVAEGVFAADLLSKAVERHRMPPAKNPPNSPHAILGALKGLLGSSQVYER
jgi:formate hydrogenlyase subunit 6/NADH:ubiquinone oxidoreductase subunit I